MCQHHIHLCTIGLDALESWSRVSKGECVLGWKTPLIFSFALKTNAIQFQIMIFLLYIWQTPDMILMTQPAM